MKLLLLHGPPAVGKLTVARDVARLTGWRLFHDHLTVDLVLSVYDFGTPGFVALREEIWLRVIRRALADDLPGVIFTFNPESSVSQRFVDTLFDEASAPHGLISVGLIAPEAEIERRMGEPSRQEHRKLTDLALYRQLRDQGVFASPVIPRTDLSIDTSEVTPQAAAERIVSFLARG